MDIDAAAIEPIRRLTRDRPQPVGRYLLAAAVVGGLVTAFELLPALGLDHGTHLLAALAASTAIAVALGPGPGALGLLAGGALAWVGSLLGVHGTLGPPQTWLQLLAYLLAGGTFILLLAGAIECGRRSARTRADAMAGPSPSVAAGSAALPEPLTERELEVLRTAASGIPVEEIAARLFLSPNTVKAHLGHIYGKLGVHGRADAVRAGLHHGCLSPEDICPHRWHGDSANHPYG